MNSGHLFEGKRPHGLHGLLAGGCAGLRAGYDGPQITLITQIIDARNLCVARACGVAARYLNAPPVICVAIYGAICVICGHIVKAGTMGPQIMQIMDARNVRTARACGVAPR
jgi:hypothetical protein